MPLTSNRRLLATSCQKCLGESAPENGVFQGVSRRVYAGSLATSSGVSRNFESPGREWPWGHPAGHSLVHHHFQERSLGHSPEREYRNSCVHCSFPRRLYLNSGDISPLTTRSQIRGKQSLADVRRHQHATSLTIMAYALLLEGHHTPQKHDRPADYTTPGVLALFAQIGRHQIAIFQITWGKHQLGKACVRTSAIVLESLKVVLVFCCARRKGLTRQD